MRDSDVEKKFKVHDIIIPNNGNCMKEVSGDIDI